MDFSFNIHCLEKFVSFLNVCVCIEQGNAATYLRCCGSFIHVLNVLLYLSSCFLQWKNFKNRLTLGKVIAKNQHPFWDTVVFVRNVCTSWQSVKDPSSSNVHQLWESASIRPGNEITGRWLHIRSLTVPFIPPNRQQT